MRSRRWRWAVVAAAAAARAASAVGPPVGTVRLTVESPAFAVSHDATAGGLLLRELQRQAVLIAARDELGLRTRDAVLGEPDAGRGTVTLWPQTRVWRASRAELRLSAVGAPGHDRPWVAFPISDDPLVDYPAFATRCEAASRGAYRDDLRAAIGPAVPARPTAWSTGPADPAAVALLVQMDVFSQCRAAQLLHAQLRADGASVDRLSALVRAYANLGQLCGGEWSAQPKAYQARALLYAERLVAHEGGSAASLYVRGYARGLADLSAAALDDLAAADAAAGPAARPPAWVAAVRGYARHDAATTAAASAAGPWRARPLAGLLSALVSRDEHPTDDQVLATDAILSVDPGPLVLMTTAVTSDDPHLSALHEPAADVLAVLARQRLLRRPPLPAAAAAAVARVTAGADAGPPNLAALDRLAKDLARAAGPDDAAEPSAAALGSLLAQEAFAAVVAHAVSLHTAGDAAETAKYLVAAGPVVRGHPWGPLVEALGVDAGADPAAVRRHVAAVPADAAGPWAGRAADVLGGDEEVTALTAERWRRPAHLLADPVVDDDPEAAAADQAERCCGGDAAEYLRRVRLRDPHSARLMAAWMAAVRPGPGAVDDAASESAVAQVEAEFGDRPAVVGHAADWCQARGQFDRELALLRGTDAVEPTPDLCDRLARVARRTGHADAAVAYCVRGGRLAGDTAAEPTADVNDRAVQLYQRAAGGLIADGRFDQALAMLGRGTSTPDAVALGLTARCRERQGRLDEAEAALRARAAVAPATLVAYALWARRLDRPSAAAVHDKAAAAAAPRPATPPAAVTLAGFYLAIADGRPGRAIDLLPQGPGAAGTPFRLAQLAAAAAAVHNSELARSAVDRAAADGAADDGGGAGFGRAFAALARSPDPAAFDAWCDRQLDPDQAADWHGVAGRYLVAVGRVAQGRAELAAVLASGTTECEEYGLAWLALHPVDATPPSAAR